MTRIADIAGYGIGTVYEYFPNRPSLLCELMHQVCEDEFAGVMRLAPSLASASVRELVTRVLEVLVASAADHRVLMKAVFVEVWPKLAPDDIEDLVPTFTEVLAEQLRLRADETGTQRPEMAARFILNGVEAIIHDAVLERPEWLESSDFLEELTALVHGYLLEGRRSDSIPTWTRPEATT